ncbi:ATP-binding protein [Desulfococcaceae bacterium HSG8]|nr:ATP-binding protein [Desulfococcaceae bacterium HSG8]
MTNNRILIVDDDPGVRESYEETLSPDPSPDIMDRGASLFGEPKQGKEPKSKKNYELFLAENGEQGVEHVRLAVEHKKPFAAAFIDMKMPGIDGAETSKRIWKTDPNIKIVIVTAYSEHTPDDIIRVTGRDDIFYLRKPFNPEEIRQFARAFTNQWNLEREKELLTSKLEKANMELDDMNKNLRHKVEEQTTRLIQSEKMASLGVLAAGVAHEINNPISFIRGNMSAIKKYSMRMAALFEKYNQLEACLISGKKDSIKTLIQEIGGLKSEHKIDFILEDMVDLAEESLEGTTRVHDIVQDLKIFSRVDEADFKNIDLNETLDATLNILRNELKYKAEIIKDYGDIPGIKCFPRKISQVFMNILMNAAQSIEESGTIRIATRYMEDDERVEISISDTGRGIPREIISKIFDPFFTTKPEGQGTGLGLSLSFDIVRAHSGEIRIETEEGKGSTFIIMLPFNTPHSLN